MKRAPTGKILQKVAFVTNNKHLVLDPYFSHLEDQEYLFL